MNQFSELSLSPVLQRNLAKQGFSEPTPVQAQAIPPALAGRDVVATAQTGTGKTLAFVLPLLETLSHETPRGGIRAVILAPTRELAMQIDETFAKISAGSGIRAALVVGGLNERTQLQAIRKGAQVLIATPGRLCDFLSRNLVNLGTVRVLVLDEADRMLDMGFLPAIKRIVAATPANRQTLFFSATMEASVKHLIEAHVTDAVRIAIGSISRPVEQVDLHLYEVGQEQKFGLLELLLRQEQGTFLVFTRTKHGADRLSKRLAAGGAKTVAIHGNRSQSQRNQALGGFQTGRYRVLVATDVVARGIHVEGIAHVVNYDLPQVPEDFIHRVGRTGRAGAGGAASTFSTILERRDVAAIERALGIRMTRHLVSGEIAPQQKATGTVIEMPQQKWRRTFSPGRRAARRRVQGAI